MATKTEKTEAKAETGKTRKTTAAKATGKSSKAAGAGGKTATTAKATAGKGGKSSATTAKGGKAASRSTGKGSRTASRVAPIKTKGKDLVIVESPAKARTVGQILGNDYVVTASQGHVRDLPQWRFGVNIEDDFAPLYEVVKDKKDLVSQLKAAGDDAKNIYLATDPDREGEAISWHLQAAADWDNRTSPPKRVVFHEITKDAVEEAFSHPREIDMQLVNAQQARRILDRLVGYQISPLLRKRVQRGVSAGRVQSVALRMVVDREREIEAFVPVESWTIDVKLRKEGQKTEFSAQLRSLKGQRGRLSISKEEDARRYEAELDGAKYAVAEVSKRDVKQRPAAPFTTSTMQQDAGRKLRFTSQRTMSVAQQLYEGLDVGEGGPVGLITYMRTDSTQVAASAVSETRDYIATRYGREFRPEKPRVYSRRSKAAQEAHEAIRPTSIRRDPASLKPYLSSEQLRLYTLVWERMLASQMADAVSEATTVDIDAACRESGNTYVFRATGSVLKFAGFRSVYLEGRDENTGDDDAKSLPRLEGGDALDCQGLTANQHFTEPPPRFSEATLIKAMEERGIGRPSTYAPTIGTLLARYYVERKQARLFPTTLGVTLTDLLKEYFPDVMNLDFTAGMEEDLDAVSRGERGWVPMLGEFYAPFKDALENATESMPRVKLEEETDEVCDDCGMPMVIKIGRFGRFMSCTGYPDCKGTKPILNKIGVACPDCVGDLVERRARGRGGRVFWGCSRYPACEFLSNRRPVPNPCPECGKMMVQQNRSTVACTSCSWQEAASQDGVGQEEATGAAGQDRAAAVPERAASEELVGVGD